MNILFKVLNLQVDYNTNFIGLERKCPMLGWEVETERRCWLQSAYQILVSQNEENLSKHMGDMWDSGKVLSKESVNVKYNGKVLESEKRYYWMVRIWDKDDELSEYSKINYWEMGLMKPEDWKAKWVGLTDNENQILPIFRLGFNIEKTIKNARIYICGLGHYELYLNGGKVGDHVLDPGWTNYKKKCLYSVYDATEMVKTGKNAFGVMLGNGMFNVKGGRYSKFKGSFGTVKFMLQMKVEFTDGSSIYIISDENWKLAPSPIIFSCIYGGEDYDARKEQEGWCTADFTEGDSWIYATIIDAPGGVKKSQVNPPIKVMKTFEPISISEPRPGVYVYDFGQNFSGWVKIEVQGSSGDEVKITPSELLTKEGMAYQRFTGSPYYFLYTLKGGSTETWNPRFSYYGFRYVQVEGAIPVKNSDRVTYKDKPILKGLEGEMIYPDVKTVGEFQCSDPLFNKIHEIINWSILSNMKSVLTDCPHREKFGWLEQTHLIGPSIMYNYNVHNLYLKILDDIKEAQLDNGLVPDIAPEYVLFGYHEGFRDSPEWGSASVINPWYIYKKYGDIEVLKENYEVMLKYVDYLTTRADRNILRHGLGDWLDVGPTPPYCHNTPIPITATSIYYYDVTIMENVSILIGKQEDTLKYAQLRNNIKNSFNHEFFDDQALRYVTGSQTSNAMPLFLGMVEKQYEEKVLESLVKDIRIRKNHTTAGDVGHPFVLLALTKYGRSDVIFDMLKIKDNPSYGYQIENGATTLCEDWDGPDQSHPHGSQNHFMLGSAEEWFYNGLAGIQTIRSESFMDEIVIKPYITSGIEWVKAYHKNSYGRIEIQWKRLFKEDKLTLKVSIPANTSGTIYLPAFDVNQSTEGGKPLLQIDDVKIVEEKENCIVLKVGSGKYSFIL